MELNKRQTDILEIVKENGPITGEQIAVRLNLVRATIRPDLSNLDNGRLSRCKTTSWLFLLRKETG